MIRLYINGLTKTFNYWSTPLTENYGNSFGGFELLLKSLAIIETFIFYITLKESSMLFKYAPFTIEFKQS